MAELAAFRRELEAYIDEALSPDGRQAIFVSLAREALADFEAAWRERSPGVTFERFVDGVKTPDISSVAPGGVISERVVTIIPMVRRALELFDIMTKVVTGGYKSKTFVFAGGRRVTRAEDLNNEDEFVAIANVSEFSRKAEQRGFNLAGGVNGTGGLFETIASILDDEFSDAANTVYFTYRTIEGNRVPIIAIGNAAGFAGIRRGGEERDNDKGKRRRNREAKRRARRRRGAREYKPRERAD